MAASKSVSGLIDVLSVLIFIGILFMPKSHAIEPDTPHGEGFGYSSMNVIPDGANGIDVWLSGTVRVRLSNTLNGQLRDGEFYGVGIVESQLSRDDLAQASDIHRRLCEAARQKPSKELEPMRPPLVYSVTCMEGEQLTPYQGQWHELPRDLAFQLANYQSRILRSYASRGRAILKLNVVVTEVKFESGKLLVSVKLINSGRYPIMMRTPDNWSQQFRDRLVVGGRSKNDGRRWHVDLAGSSLVNQGDFTDAIITVAAGTAVVFRFMAVPNEKIERGTYNVDALVVTGISGDGIASSMGRVGFTSDNSKPAVVTFDRDYPSTPGELENYEAHKREVMSSQPVFPGSEFAEDGYYRAVSILSEQRSRFVTEFRKGQRAPEPEGVVDQKGQPVLHPRATSWIWEADSGLTSTVCEPGKFCPRTGRWFARILQLHKLDYDDRANQEIHCRAGQVMPGGAELPGGGLLRWEWIGV